jgi:hypothetical protein
MSCGAALERLFQYSHRSRCAGPGGPIRKYPGVSEANPRKDCEEKEP